MDELNDIIPEEEDLTFCPKTYLLRWNPNISQLTLKTYREAVKNFPEGFSYDWSIHEYETAREGDMFYMLRTGDDKAGIVSRGIFTSNPYKNEEWDGKSSKRFNVMIDCYTPSGADAPPHISLRELKKFIPGIDWEQGNSGELITESQADKLDKLWCKHVREE